MVDFDADQYIQANTATAQFNPDQYIADNSEDIEPTTSNTEAIGRGLESTVQPIYTGIASAVDKEPFKQESAEQEALKNQAFEDHPISYGLGKVGGIAGEAALAPEALGDVATNAGISALGSNWSKPAEAIGQTALGGVTGGILGKTGDIYNKSGIPEKMANDLLGTEANPEALNIVKNATGISGSKANLSESANSLINDIQDKFVDEMKGAKELDKETTIEPILNKVSDEIKKVSQIDPTQAKEYVDFINKVAPDGKLPENVTNGDLYGLLNNMRNANWDKEPTFTPKGKIYNFVNDQFENNLNTNPKIAQTIKTKNNLVSAIKALDEQKGPQIQSMYGMARNALKSKEPLGSIGGGILGFLTTPGGFLGRMAGGEFGQAAGRGAQQALVKGLPKGISKLAIPAISQGVNKAVNSYSQGGMIPDDVKNYVKKYADGGPVNLDNAEQIEPGIYGNTDPGNINKIVNGLASGIAAARGVEGLSNLPEALKGLGEAGEFTLGKAPQSAEELKNLASTLKKGDIISLPKGSAEYVGVQPGFEEIPDTHLFNAVGKDLPEGAIEGSTYSPETMEKLGMFKNPDMTLVQSAPDQPSAKLTDILQKNGLSQSPVNPPTQLPNSGMNALTTDEEKQAILNWLKGQK